MIDDCPPGFSLLAKTYPGSTIKEQPAPLRGQKRRFAFPRAISALICEWNLTPVSPIRGAGRAGTLRRARRKAPRSRF